MHNDIATNESLLLKLRDSQDREAWEQFVQIYSPAILRVAKRLGLQEADAMNLSQDVLLKIGRSAESWAASNTRGSFRRWLVVVSKNAALDALRRCRPDAPRGGTTMIKIMNDVQDDDQRDESILTRELRLQAFRWAATRVQSEFVDSTWQAFWMTMVDGRDCDQVANELGKSVGAIYTARSRVMQRIKSEVTSFDASDVEGAPCVYG